MEKTLKQGTPGDPIPRPEHPKPQFARKSWLNLNGYWDFEIDNGRSGTARGLSAPDAKLQGRILVPFCPESGLSGVGHKDFMYGVWYQRRVSLTPEQCAGRVFLHFGAVDYACRAFVNGEPAGEHRGGYVSFSFEITKLVKAGENTITVYAEDDTRDPMIPRGKQCESYYSFHCDYTRTTGIWQTVWLEFTPKAYIRSVRFDADCIAPAVHMTAELEGAAEFSAEILYEGRRVGELKRSCDGGELRASVALSEKHLWQPGDGKLYDVRLLYGEDSVESYFGLRSIRLSPEGFFLNGAPVFQRLILDQGFYPDGIYTAPSDEQLARDIDLSMAMGFNGARLHEKIFEERFLYHCDRKGYLVWGEYPSWGLDHTDPMALYSVLPEWLEELRRDCNHPAIIGWCPFNETWNRDGRKQYDDVLRMVYRVTKAVDPGRPCIDSSGNFHVETDIFDMHDYEQDTELFRSHYGSFPDGGVYNRFDDDSRGRDLRHGDNYGRQSWNGEPVMVTEYGGIKWTGSMERPNDDSVSWGYGRSVGSYEELKERFKGLTDALLDNPRILGLCYTQLTDVEQEQNGLYTCRREPKFDPDWVRSVVTRKAASEK